MTIIYISNLLGCGVFKPHALLVRSTFYLILNKYVQAIEDVNVIIMDENTPPEVRNIV